MLKQLGKFLLWKAKIRKTIIIKNLMVGYKIHMNFQSIMLEEQSCIQNYKSKFHFLEAKGSTQLEIFNMVIKSKSKKWIKKIDQLTESKYNTKVVSPFLVSTFLIVLAYDSNKLGIASVSTVKPDGRFTSITAMLLLFPPTNLKKFKWTQEIRIKTDPV